MEKNNTENVRYFIRESGKIVRLSNDVIVEFLDNECNWVLNQEWFDSMFSTGEDSFQEVNEEFVNNYIFSRLHSKRKIR